MHRSRASRARTRQRDIRLALFWTFLLLIAGMGAGFGASLCV